MNALWSHVLHQGTLCEVTAPTVAILFRLCAFVGRESCALRGHARRGLPSLEQVAGATAEAPLRNVVVRVAHRVRQRLGTSHGIRAKLDGHALPNAWIRSVFTTLVGRTTLAKICRRPPAQRGRERYRTASDLTAIVIVQRGEKRRACDRRRRAHKRALARTDREGRDACTARSNGALVVHAVTTTHGCIDGVALATGLLTIDCAVRCEAAVR